MVFSGANVTIYEKYMDSSSSVPGTGIKKNRLWLVYTCTQKKKNTFFGVEQKDFGVAFMAEDPNSRPVITTASSPYLECGNSSTETPWYDKESMLRVPKYLILVEVVSSLNFTIIMALKLDSNFIITTTMGN